jgi:hypothetical protein
MGKPRGRVGMQQRAVLMRRPAAIVAWLIAMPSWLAPL